jgi:hypothetical protein
LCDDGTLWRIGNSDDWHDPTKNHWRQVVDVPQPADST